MVGFESDVMAIDRTVVVRECVDRSNWESGSITNRVEVGSILDIVSNDES